MKSVALYLLVFFIFAFAGEIVTWEKQYDGGYYDFGKKIISLNDGNFLVGAQRQNGNNEDRIWMMKFNADGDTIWTKYDGTVSDRTHFYIRDIATNDNSDIFVADMIAPVAGARGHAYRKDSAFNDIWSVTFPAFGMMASNTNSIECTPDSGCVVSWTEQMSFESSVDYIQKFDKDGNSEKYLYIPNFATDSILILSNDIEDIKLDNDVNLLAAGNVWGSNLEYNSEFRFSYLIKYDNNLDTLWNVLYEAEDYYFKEIEYTLDGCYLVVGGDFILKINTTGETIWCTTIPEANLKSVVNCLDSNYVVASYNNIYKLDQGGNILWTQDYGCYDLVATDDGGFLAVGIKNSNVWIYKMDENGDYSSIDPGQSGIIYNYSLHQNYPNPFNNTTTIPYKLNENSDVQINIYNAKGEIAFEISLGKQNKGDYNYQLNANELTAGIYYYSLLIDGKAVDNKKMLYLK
ncbi:MAG: T9SS type A sorting domain-containing protein [Endomicrobiaceae bacterium]|jgi:hypothetical protein|nr:T9SS type A sorting domain-containing protein [Endomicrobiaceae bacterium]